MILKFSWYKNMLNSTISMSYPDVGNCMYRTRGCLWRHSEQVEAALVKHDNNMKDYSLVVD